MRYRDLKDERDAAVARAVEAERLSMKSEFDRVTEAYNRETLRLIEMNTEATSAAYRNGFNAGLDAMADDIDDRLRHRTGLVPPSLKKPPAEKLATITVVSVDKEVAGPCKHGAWEADETGVQCCVFCGVAVSRLKEG